MEDNEVKVEAEMLNTSKTSNNEDTIISEDMLNNEKKEKMPKRVFISIDKTFEDVIQYQHEGYSLFFADGEGELLELTPEQVKELNPYNREKYRVAVEIVNKTLDLTSVKTSHMKFKPKASFASATNRLRVENKKPGLHYAWKRQDDSNK